MKKVLLTIGSMIMLSLLIVLFVNAKTTSDPVKAKNEVKKEAPATPCGSGCMMHGQDKPAAGNTEKCGKECNGKCDPEKCTEKDCDPATCPMHQEAKKEAAACMSAAPCSATCGEMKTAAK